MIHVCFGLHDKTGRYSKFTGTAMCSLFDNTSAAVTVHILHDNTLTQDNREKFIYLAGQYNQRVKFYNVETLCADKLTEMVNLVPAVKTARVSVGAFYRLLSPQILSANIDKCIYLDADIIVNLDIKTLWQVEIGEKILAAVPETSNGVNTKKELILCRLGYVQAEDYFNSGILLMSLNRLRCEEENLKRGIIFRGKHETGCFDQDILNYLYSTSYVKMPVEFNYFIKTHRNSDEVISFGKIYHYTDTPSGVGLSFNTKDTFNRLWMDYFIKTPFFDAETFGRLYNGFQQIHVGLKNSMIKISAMMSGKTRAFFTAPNNRDAVKKIFSVRDGEQIILAENNKSLKKLLDAMKNSRGKKVFFVMLPNFPFDVLIKEGFKSGVDFVNGFEFLSEAHGVPLNSYQFIKAM